MKVEFKTNITNFLVEPFYMKTRIVEEFGEEIETERDATILTASEIEEIRQKIDGDTQINILFKTNLEYYREFNFKTSNDIGKYYTIKDYDEDDHSIYLTHDEDGGAWLPIIFIREFWEFYSNYNHTVKEEEPEIETAKTDIEIIANNLVEYIDKIQGVITIFSDMCLPKEDTSFLIQKTISSWIKK